MLADPPSSDARSGHTGRANVRDIILGCPVDTSIRRPHYGVREISEAVSLNMGVSSHFLICDRHGPVINGASTRGPAYWSMFNSNRDIYAINLRDYSAWRPQTLNLLQSSYNFDVEMYLDGETVLGEFSDVAGDVQDDQLPGPSGYVPSNSDVQPTNTHTPTDTNPDNNTNITDTDLHIIMLRVVIQVWRQV